MFFTFNTGAFLLFRRYGRETVARFFLVGQRRQAGLVRGHREPEVT